MSQMPVHQSFSHCREMWKAACCGHYGIFCFLSLQVRSSLFELAKKTKFNLCRHVLVTFILLVIINLLVIFIPSMKDIFGVVGTAFWLSAYSIYNSCLETWSFTITTSNFVFPYFSGVTSANMLIFILPSSLYLKITSQDGDKGAQQIWVRLMPATLIFLISFSLNYIKYIVHLHQLILLLGISKVGSTPSVCPFGKFKISEFSPFPQNIFRFCSFVPYFALRGQGQLKD